MIKFHLIRELKCGYKPNQAVRIINSTCFRLQTYESWFPEGSYYCTSVIVKLDHLFLSAVVQPSVLVYPQLLPPLHTLKHCHFTLAHSLEKLKKNCPPLLIDTDQDTKCKKWPENTTYKLLKIKISLIISHYKICAFHSFSHGLKFNIASVLDLSKLCARTLPKCFGDDNKRWRADKEHNYGGL